MYVVADSIDAEMRLTVEAAAELANLSGGADQIPATAIREVLADQRYPRAADATAAEITATTELFAPTAALMRQLPFIELPAAVAGLNEALSKLDVHPSVQAHDGAPLHLHWTDREAAVGEQVVADMLLALAHTLCDSGLERFGVCDAEDCERIYFDTTRNRSRRFCSDSRCASRTHTAEYRARRRDG